jgi:Ca-activated chloride channel family protein
MNFLVPAAFALAALMPVIVAMYLLKLRRVEQVVSSVYLWRRMVRDVEANAPWQRLRRNLLLILQLLFLATLIMALARPFRWAEGSSGQALILILDTSASMAANDVSPSRLGVARAQARRLLDGLTEGARVTLISAGDGAQVLVASSRDRRQVHLALDALQVGTGGSDLTAALALASAIATAQAETEIVVFSDGRVTLPERLALRGDLGAEGGPIRYVPVGQSGDNQAISTLSLEPAPGGEGMTAFAQITNYGDVPAQRRLALYADDQLVNAYDLKIEPGHQRAVVADGLPSNTRILEARLADQDALAFDDRAWTVARGLGPIPVTLVTDGNLFLETALSLLPAMQVTSVKPDDFEKDWRTGESGEDEPSAPVGQRSSEEDQPISAQSGAGDTLFVLDAYVPITPTLPAGNLLFIAPPSSTEYFTVTGRVDLPVPRAVDSDDPLLAHTNLQEVSVLEAVRMSLPPWARPVIIGDSSPPGEAVPLLFAGEVDGRRVAVLAFDLHRSDLPLQVAFPLLLANLTGWLAPGGAGDLPRQVPPGAAVALSLAPETKSVTVTRPDGSTVRLVPEGGGTVFADTDQLGVYRMSWDQDQEARFAVNLFSPQESDVLPAETLPVQGTGEAGKGQRPQQARREWWRPLALVGLGLLVAEWLVYQRASLSRLWREGWRAVRLML